jgi:hypothetical protein
MTNMAAAASGAVTCQSCGPGAAWSQSPGEGGGTDLGSPGGMCAGALSRTWLPAAADSDFACQDFGERLVRDWGTGAGAGRSGSVKLTQGQTQGGRECFPLLESWELDCSTGVLR